MVKAKRGITFDTVREIGRGLKDVVESISYRTPALRVRKKLLVRLKEDGESLVVLMDFDAREILMKADPRAFYITDHYHDYPAVLVHLSQVTRDQMTDIMKMSYRFVTTKPK